MMNTRHTTISFKQGETVENTRVPCQLTYDIDYMCTDHERCQAVATACVRHMSKIDEEYGALMRIARFYCHTLPDPRVHVVKGFESGAGCKCELATITSSIEYDSGRVERGVYKYRKQLYCREQHAEDCHIKSMTDCESDVWHSDVTCPGPPKKRVKL